MIAVVVPAKQIGHYIDARVTGVVKARKAESGFERSQQREAVVVASALDTLLAAVGFNGEDHPVWFCGGNRVFGGS